MEENQLSGSDTEPASSECEVTSPRPRKRQRTGYRAQRKTFFLTYPKCDVPKEEVLRQLELKGEIAKYLIATEKHQDGTDHVHCFISYKKKKNFRTARWGDLTYGTNPEKTYHFNDGGAVRDHFAVARYVSKDSDFISNFYEIDPYKLALASEDATSALKIIEEKRPRDWTLYLQKLEYAYSKKFRVDTFPKYRLDQFTLPRQDLSKSLVIYGESGTGKTQFAKAHFERPLLISHIDQLKIWNPQNHDGLVFDDMTFSHWPPTAVIHLLDMDEDRHIHCRNTNGIIPAGFPRIFTINSSNGSFPPIFIKHDDINPISVEVEAAIKRRYNTLCVTDSIIKT